MHEQSLLGPILVFLVAAVVAVPIFKRIGLGSVLGYLAAGSVIGPFGLKLIGDPQSVMHLAELGVVLFLFVIGLELKPTKLWSMRKAVFGGGTAQLVVTGGVIAGIAMSFGCSLLASVLIGIGLSLSSTAFALQLLGERNELNTPFGQFSFAVLLFQDVAVIPLLALMPLLAEGAGESTVAPAWVVVAVIASIAFGGRYVMKPVFRIVAWTHAKEIFTATALLLVLGIAAVMQKIGLSMALGSFLAGVVLSDSEYRHELEADIEPFKGLLMGLFFMGIGISVDYGLVLRFPVLIFVLAVSLIVVKSILLFLLGRAHGLNPAGARGMAAVISQGGEFAFVLFSMAAGYRILPTETSGVLMVVVALSMALTPLVVLLNDRFGTRLAARKPEFDQIHEENPVIIAGYGRVGQIPARILRVKGIGFTALEHDPEQVDVARKFGQKIYYGDASRLDLLEAAGARKAKFFVLAIDDVESSVRTAAIVRQHFPHLKIFARARNRSHANELHAVGVPVIYRETLASSLELTQELLIELGHSVEKAADWVRKFREHDEELLRKQFAVRKDEQALISVSKEGVEQLTQVLHADKK